MGKGKKKRKKSRPVEKRLLKAARDLEQQNQALKQIVELMRKTLGGAGK